MSFKRRRGAIGRVAAPRPIDKTLTVIVKNDVGSSTQTTDLVTATTACTAVDIRWTFYVEGDGGTAGLKHDYSWLIALVPDGTTINSIALTDAASMYDPEQHVLAFGYGCSADASAALVDPFYWLGTTKTSRKLRIGDKITFAVKGITTETVRVRGCVQIFCKS